MKPDGFHLSDSQRGSLKIAWEKYGYSEGDFEVLQGQTPEEAVYVTYKPTGFRRMYDGTSWKSDFEEDLKNRIFTS